MIWVYRLLFPFALLASSPYYLVRMRRRGGYAGGFLHRLGMLPALPARRAGVRRVWLQAVSVGEMLAVEPILRALNEDGTEVVLTTTTSTGYRLAVDRYSDLVCAVAYFPIDWLPFSSRAWKAIDPDLAVVTEGERWPEHHAPGGPTPGPGPLHQRPDLGPELPAAEGLSRGRAVRPRRHHAAPRGLGAGCGALPRTRVSDRADHRHRKHQAGRRHPAPR